MNLQDMQPIIRVEDLHYTYPGDEIETLHGLDLEIAEGSFVAVLGHNGSGKSTLAKLMNAILLPTSGKVYVDGIDTADEERLLDIRRTVGMVFQNPDNQIVANVVEDDVAFAPENLGVEPAEIRRRVDEALKTVGMYDYRLHAPHLLSGGQKQRVGIARAIMQGPKLLLCDEPIASLDPSSSKTIMDLLRSMTRKRNIACIVNLHQLDVALQYSTRIIGLSKGEIVFDGPPQQLDDETIQRIYGTTRENLMLGGKDHA